MDQKSYMIRVNQNLQKAKDELMDFADRNIERVRSELEHQHGARQPGVLGFDRPSLLKTFREARRSRHDFLPARLFADPAWDILLELTEARLEHRPVTVKVVQNAAMVPPATSIRWMNVLENEGLITRKTDPLDRRRTFVALTEDGWEAMSSWLEAMAR